ncbi:hypothetical protein ABPG77_002482 [Micractinium sp. CCAP 211/92]
MLKIDVEGREPSVIMSAPKLFAGPSKPQEIMLEFLPGFTKEGLAEMLEKLNGYDYVAKGVDWGHVRLEKEVAAIDVSQWFEQTLDISSPEARQRLIDGIAINENSSGCLRPTLLDLQCLPLSPAVRRGPAPL